MADVEPISAGRQQRALLPGSSNRRIALLEAAVRPVRMLRPSSGQLSVTAARVRKEPDIRPVEDMSLSVKPGLV
jgi:hypothetical protein